ncbi:MAG: UDP-N-acetylglucosamine 2-epimerase [Clostridium sp.]
MCIKKILAFTGIRSDYEIMEELYKGLNNSKDFEIKLIVSGAHLSHTYGYSVAEIERDGIPILCEIENLFDSNSRGARVKSLGLLLENSVQEVEKYNPDAIIYAGDREEVMVGALLGAYLRIPTIHFFGGDHAIDGNIDNVVRHSVSKLSSIHFVTNEDAKNRLLKMGEHKKRIFNVGSPSLDKLINTNVIRKKELLKSFNKNEEWNNYAMLMYYPLAGEERFCGQQFLEILMALESENVKTFVSFPNVDSGNKSIIDVIDEFKDNKNFHFYKNLNRESFINLLRNTRFLIGNSSAGVYECPLLKIPVINVGNRQKGRLTSTNVNFIEYGVENIIEGIRNLDNEEYMKQIDECESPYGNGNSINGILSLMRDLPFESFLEKCEDPKGD